jgi:3-oxoacyl-[acyl-carrier protein] reductase
LAREGVRLVIVARDPVVLEAAASGLRLEGGVEVVPVADDITTKAGRERALAASGKLTRGIPGQFDIVVTNSGGPPAGDFRDWDPETWMRAINANMITPIELIRSTVDLMIARKWGRIVNITSTAVKAPSSYMGLSNGARCGLTGFVAGVARQVAEHGVTINNLLPGTFDTDRLASNFNVAAHMTGAAVDAYREARRQAIPARRFGDPKEFGAACAFLCSENAGYITAQNILLDGGAYPGTF